MASDATKFSPSPSPTTMGDPWLGGNDATRLIGGNHGDGIAAAQTLDSRHDSLEQVTFIVVVDQMRDYFRIRLTRELIALGLKFSSDLLMILNDAVMDQRNVIARNMRMCVADLWRAMRGPTRMRDADAALHFIFGNSFAKFVHTGHGASPLEDAVVKRCNSAGIVTAIFKAAKAFQKHGHNITITRGGDDTTHIFSLQTCFGR